MLRNSRDGKDLPTFQDGQDIVFHFKTKMKGKAVAFDSVSTSMSLEFVDSEMGYK